MKEKNTSLNSNNGSLTKKISRRRKFQQKWLDVEQFKPWLCEVSHNENLFFCSFCNKSIVGGKSQIWRHGKSKAHIKMSEDNNIETNETNKTNETNESNEDDNMLSNESLLSQITFEERKKSAEIRFAALIADKNIPYQTAEDILSFFQQIGEDYHVLKNMSMGRTKCKNIITNVLYPVEMNRVVNSIQKTKFSIFIDETFDISNEKWTTFFVRYVDPETLDIRSQLVKLINIDDKNKCDDVMIDEEKLFHVFQCEMSKLNIPFLNIVALSCNDASAMTDTYLSFKEKLEETCKNLLTFSCPCHSTALAVTTAYRNIPDYCKDFLKKIANYINNSPKNSTIYEEFSECIQETNCKILKLSDTRWLSHYSYIKKLLESWDTIKFFLAKMDRNEKSKSSGQDLLIIMEKLEVKAYLLFLKHILFCFNSFNIFFQTLETKIHLLQPKSVEFLTIVSKYFLKQKFLNHLCNNNIQFSQKEHQKSLNKVNLGSECEEYLEKLMKEGHANIVGNVRENCLQFYVTAAEEISKRLPINDKFLSKLKVFQGETALREPDRETSFNDVSFIAQTFGGFDQNGLRKEWHTLYLEFTQTEKQNLVKLNFDDMWKQILQCQYSINNSKYPNLKSLLNAVRSLPNSNTDPEKIFSFISDLKTTKRKKLSSVCINTINVLQSALKTKKETVLNMQINAKHLSLMSSDKLYTNCFPKQKNNVTSFASDNNDIVDPSSSNDIQ
nr:PREDICTED: zinc finger MYM-type protein 6 isoform X2 [Linepithema humile]